MNQQEAEERVARANALHDQLATTTNILDHERIREEYLSATGRDMLFPVAHHDELLAKATDEEIAQLRRRAGLE